MIRLALRLALVAPVLVLLPAASPAQDGPVGPLRQVFGPPVKTLKQAIQGERPAAPSTGHAAPAAGEAEPAVAAEAGDGEDAAPPPAVAIPLPRMRPAPDGAAVAAGPSRPTTVRFDFAARFEAGPPPAPLPAPAAEPAPAPDTPFLSYAPEDDDVPTPRPRVASAAVRLASLPTGRAVDTPAPSGCMQSLRALGVVAVSMAPIKDGGCGIAAPTAVSALGGGNVTLSEKAVLSCRTAEMLAEWMRDEVQPAARQHLGASVTGIRVAASYHCRGRNNIAGAKLSEHAFGNAIDISAFRIEGVGWVEVGKTKGASAGRFVAAVRKAACGPFTTVLGPGADPYHSDHLHLDVIRRGKNGNSLYCK